MITFISDTNLTDGTLGETIHPGAFAAFRERFRDLAYDASWRSDGKYRPIEELDLVLLGDTIDFLRSTKWLSIHQRPWSGTQDPELVAKVAEITEAILTANKKSLDILKGFVSGNVITLPPATQDGIPARVSREPDAPERLPVRVHIHYVAGNHDRMFHRRGSAYDCVRNKAVDAMGLVNAADVPFPHDPFESDLLKQTYRAHHVFGRHGDIFDSFNYDQDPDASSLGDAIVIELLNKFPEAVIRQLGSEVPEVCRQGLCEIDNVRPLLITPVWMNGLLRRTCTDPLAKKIKDVWDGLVDEFLEIEFVRKHHSISQLFDDVTKLEWALKFSRGVSLANLSKVVSWCKDRLGIQEAGFYPNAFNEAEFKNRNAQFIVYGHTHNYEIVPLDTVASGTGVLEQLYLNSGTWRAVHELAQLHPAQQQFIGYHVMTYLTFFKDDERGGRSFESWSGALNKS